MDRPLFSVIIPTYNHAQYISKALESVLAQTWVDWEIVVVNDGSTDDTGKIIDEYGRKDERIRPLHKPNGGTASAINLGVRNAQGAWICWLSSDDWFEPDKLETHQRYIQQYPDCRFFFSHFHMYDEFEKKTIDRDLFGPLPEREFQIPLLYYRNYVMGVGICINHELWNQIGEMDETLKYAQDYDMWLRVLTAAPGIFIPERTFTYRHHPGQGSETFTMACLFDASKAAIRHLNTHVFEELFPLLDLHQEVAAVKTIHKALEIAADPTSFLYSIGPNPALLLRLLEWVARKQGSQQKELIQVFEEYAAHVSRNYAGTAFGNIWSASAMRLNNLSPDFQYRPVSYRAVALVNYAHCIRAKHPLALSLKKYLETYDGISLEHFQPEWYEGKLPENALEKYLQEPNLEEFLAPIDAVVPQPELFSLSRWIKEKLKRVNLP